MDKPNFNDVAQFLIAIVMIAGFIYLTNMLILPATPNTDLIELLAAVLHACINHIELVPVHDETIDHKKPE